MYLEYWGLERFPFDNAPDPNFFYVSNTHEEALNRLLYAAELGKGCALLAGDIHLSHHPVAAPREVVPEAPREVDRVARIGPPVAVPPVEALAGLEVVGPSVV